MRAFIAIDFSDETKREIIKIQNDIKQHALSGRWKRKDNFHLTLKFLGEITPGMADKIVSLMNNVAIGHRQFDLKFDKIGFFKGKDNFRVVWLGMQNHNEALYNLQADVEETSGMLGFKNEKRFSPHITLGQDVRLDIPFEELESTVKIDIKPLIVDAFCLMDSRVINGKRVYTPVKQFELLGR